MSQHLFRKLAALTVGLCLAPAAALAQPAAAPESPVATPEAAVLALTVPAGLVLHRVVGTLLVGATDDGKLVTYDVTDPRTPQKRSEQDVGGTVIELRVADGIVFAVVAEQKVQAFAVAEGGKLLAWRPQLQTAAQASTGAVPTGRATSVILGKVAEARQGNVLIELDEAGTLRPGDFVLVRSQTLEKRLNLFTGKDEEAVSNAPVAVIEVRQVQGRKAVAELGRGEAASPGDTVERTERPKSQGILYAQRVGHTSWARATLRPFMNFGEIDVGSVTELAAGYYWKALHLQVHLSPVGLSVPNGVDLLNAQVIASYATDLAEFGVGTGYYRSEFEAENEWGCDSSGFLTTMGDAAASSEGGAPKPQTYRCSQSGPSVVQHLRLGAVDGLNLRMTNTLVIDRGEFRFSYLDGSLDIPLGRVLNLYGAGGGAPGVGWGEIGTRTYLRGVGAKDTLILTTGLGLSKLNTANVFGGTVQKLTNWNTNTEYWGYVDSKNSVFGLHVTVGMEARF